MSARTIARALEDVWGEMMCPFDPTHGTGHDVYGVPRVCRLTMKERNRTSDQLLVISAMEPATSFGYTDLSNAFSSFCPNEVGRAVARSVMADIVATRGGRDFVSHPLLQQRWLRRA